MRIARVFASRTNMSPKDADAYFASPDMFTPKYDEVHVSCTFTWDKPVAEKLAYQWQGYGKVIIGGPAYGSDTDTFKPGMYLKAGCVFTSRGCPRQCPWCFVWRREGKVRELPVQAGNIIMDNNLLACSKSHIDKVIEMLKTQKDISFNQGLDARLLTDNFVESIRGLRIKDIWLAADYDGSDVPLGKAVRKLERYFNRNKLRCYVLIGFRDDTIEKAESRLIRAYEIGTLPFAMLYRDENTRVYSRDWKTFQRKWARPAAYKSFMRRSNP